MLTEEKKTYLTESKANLFRVASLPVERASNWVLPLRALENTRHTRDGVHYDWSTYLAAAGLMVGAL